MDDGLELLGLSFTDYDASEEVGTADCTKGP
jgi:hypothetical protein